MKKSFSMAKTYINAALCIMVALYSTPIFSSENTNQPKQSTEQTENQVEQTTFQEKEQQSFDLIAAQKDLQKVVAIATFVGLT